jgi:hypothetical protein
MFLKGLLILVSFISPVFSWGSIGHAVIGSISQDYLTSQSFSQISSLIPDGNMSAVANWADEIKKYPEYHWTSSLHFINTPDWQCNYYYEKDCFNESNDFNFCVDGAIRNYTSLLQTNKKPDYLKFLIHFVGDIHQPLHCGFKSDRGGNSIKVHFNHHQTELHAVWDSGLIEYRIQKYFDNSIDNWVNFIKKNYIQKNDKCVNCSELWGKNSAKLACEYSYVNEENNKIESGDYLDNGYFERNIPIIEKQIADASINLANIINYLFSV